MSLVQQLEKGVLNPDPRKITNSLNPNFDREVEYPDGHKARMPEMYRDQMNYPKRAKYAVDMFAWAEWQTELLQDHQAEGMCKNLEKCKDIDPSKVKKEDVWKGKGMTRRFSMEYWKLPNNRLEYPKETATLDTYHSQRLRGPLMKYLNSDMPYGKAPAPVKAYLVFELKERMDNKINQMEYFYTTENIDKIVKNNLKLMEINKKLVADNERLHAERKDFKSKIKILKYSLNGRKNIITKLFKVIHYGNKLGGGDTDSYGCWSTDFIESLETPSWFQEEDDLSDSDDSLDEWALSDLP